MSVNEQEEEQKVKVRDRRRFVMDDAGNVVGRPDAEVRDRTDHELPRPSPAATPSEQPQRREQPAASASAAKAPAATQTAAGAQDETPEDKLASQIFLEFLNSLAHSLLVHLGEIPDPGSGLVRENLEAAQQTLEILGVLRKKTNGNLSAQEARMFDSLIYELMMRFRQKIETVRGPVPPRPGQ